MRLGGRDQHGQDPARGDRQRTITAELRAARDLGSNSADIVKRLSQFCHLKFRKLRYKNPAGWL
jgi:hypothetical protein